jgi:hypothetical protein
MPVARLDPWPGSIDPLQQSHCVVVYAGPLCWHCENKPSGPRPGSVIPS